MNRSLVLNLVRDRDCLSRAQLARLSGLSPSTITAIVGQLVEERFLLEDAGATDGAGEPGGLGRPATPVRVNPTAGYVVGIKVNTTDLAATLIDLEARPLAYLAVARETAPESGAVADLFQAVVTGLCAKAGVDRASILGVGIGAPGTVDPASGRSAVSPLPEWSELDLVTLVSERLGLPVHLDNDVNTLAIAEQLFGAGRGIQHFMVVTIGRGIGLGAVLNGSVYRGGKGGAGELGHVLAVPDGPLCWCGRQGCLEAVAAEPALVRDVEAATGLHVPPESLASAAAGDDRIAGILANAGRLVGIAIVNAATVLDPERVIVSGEGVRLGPTYLEPLSHIVAERTRWKEASAKGVIGGLMPIVEPWGDDAWARGAATLVLRELFHPAHLHDEASAASAAPDRAGGHTKVHVFRGETR
jgi:predicted NBD/HSP70 family sugar kinase